MQVNTHSSQSKWIARMKNLWAKACVVQRMAEVYIQVSKYLSHVVTAY